MHTQSLCQPNENAFASHHLELLHQVWSQGLDQISSSPSSTCVPKLQLGYCCKSFPPYIYLKLCSYQSKLQFYMHRCIEKDTVNPFNILLGFCWISTCQVVHWSSTSCWVSCTAEAKCKSWWSSLSPISALLTPAQKLCFALSSSISQVLLSVPGCLLNYLPSSAARISVFLKKRNERMH